MQWHQLDHMQTICTSLQTDNHATTSYHSIFTGRMLLLTPNQQCQSTEGNKIQQDTIPIFCGISPGGGTERDTVGRVYGKRIVFKLVDYRSAGKDWTPNHCCMCVS